MGPRLELQALLKTLCPNVYFQPPPSIKLQFPCIIYKRDSANTAFADNQPHLYTKRYQVTVIDTNPDSPISDQVAALPMCEYDRFYTADNLNHDVFRLFF